MKSDLGTDLQQFVGSTNSETVTDSIRKTLEDAMNSSNGVKESLVKKCCTLWDDMSFIEKLRWFVYSRFPLKELGDRDRRILELSNQVERLHWKLSNPKSDWADFHHSFQLPRHLELYPRSIMIVEAMVHLAQGIEFVTTNVTIDKDDQE